MIVVDLLPVDLLELAFSFPGLKVLDYVSGTTPFPHPMASPGMAKPDSPMPVYFIKSLL